MKKLKKHSAEYFLWKACFILGMLILLCSSWWQMSHGTWYIALINLPVAVLGILMNSVIKEVEE